MKDPLGQIEVKSPLIHATRLSFEIKLKTDVIRVRCTMPPYGGQWPVHFESKKYGDWSIPLYKVPGGANATPKAIARRLCEEIGAPPPTEIRNIRRNYVEFVMPEPMSRGPIRTNDGKLKSGNDRRDVCVMFADLRGFSKWSSTASPEDLNHIFSFMSNSLVQMSHDYSFDYWKLTGDGFMFVWETGTSGALRSAQALEVAYEVSKDYWYFRDKASIDVPEGFGVGITAGHVTKYWTTDINASFLLVDYLGPVVNYAARLQQFAGPGQVLVNRRIAKETVDDWFSFKELADVSKAMAGQKGVPASQARSFLVSHKYFNSDWERFLERP